MRKLELTTAEKWGWFFVAIFYSGFVSVLVVT